MTISVRRGGGGGGEVELGDELETIAAITPTDDDLIQRKAGAWVNRTPEQVKADLDIAEYTPDADITAIGNLTPSDDDLIQRKAGAWTNRTPAQVKADLGIVDATPSPFTLDAGSTVIVPVDVADSWVVGANQLDRDAAASPAENVRALFDKTTGAFRAGSTTGAAWDAASRGAQSHATGLNTTASGAQALATGSSSTAAGAQAVATGNFSEASGAQSLAGGSSAIASGEASFAYGYIAEALGSFSRGGGRKSRATRYGQDAWATADFADSGDAQFSRFVASRSTSSATPAVLTFDGGASVFITGASTNVLTIPINRAHQFRVSVVARRSDVSGDAAGWTFEGLLARGSSGNAAFVGTVDARAWGSAGAAAWDVTLTVNTSNATNNYLVITVTGEAAKTIRWVATIETTEVG
jgi:hypothetical protein